MDPRLRGDDDKEGFSTFYDFINAFCPLEKTDRGFCMMATKPQTGEPS
jgi:hypothetical protein